LDNDVNYYISQNQILQREGFQVVSSIGRLVDELSVTVAGQIAGTVHAEFLRGLGEAYLEISIGDLNNVIQRKPGAISVYYEASFEGIPSFLDILLLEPAAIVDAVNGIFKDANDLTLGENGIVTKFDVPFIGSAVSRSLKAGTPDHFLEKARRTVVGTLEDIMTTYSKEDSQTTVADIIANVLTDILGDELEILSRPVSVSYYEHTNGTLVHYDSYDDELNVKSIMWEIPFGQTFTITLPPLNFDIGNDKLPIQIKMDQTQNPELVLEWGFKLAFGFDEEAGFFLYTYPMKSQSSLSRQTSTS
jgi:hypothetical protein